MPGSVKTNAQWYRDEAALARGEPGIRHSFVRCLASALDQLDGAIDPTQVMGASAFAFRIWSVGTLCPSAMCQFDFPRLVSAAAHALGRHVTFVSRFCDEREVERERRDQAHAAIVGGLARGFPSIVWDVSDAEWGLLTGYDEREDRYELRASCGRSTALPRAALGRGGTGVLAVATLDERFTIDPSEVAERSLTAAISHADGLEWTDRPTYRDGLDAYSLWAETLEKVALIVEHGRAGALHARVWDFARCHAEHHAAARCYARDYLAGLAEPGSELDRAAFCYEEVASSLLAVWNLFRCGGAPTPAQLRAASSSVLAARCSEQAGLDAIRRHLGG